VRTKKLSPGAASESVFPITGPAAACPIVRICTVVFDPAAIVETAWDIEIIRPMEDLDSGKVKPVAFLCPLL
jgi:hypothetical protein